MDHGVTKPLERLLAEFGKMLRGIGDANPFRETFSTGTLDPEIGIALFSLLAFALVVILMGYTLVRRLLTEARERREYILRHRWMRWIAQYLVGDQDAGDRIRAMARKEFRFFVELITEYLTDLEGEDRHKLVLLLHERGYTIELHQMLRWRKEGERAFAARLLGLLRAEESTEELRNLLGDSSETVRFAAASALMQINDIDAIPALFRGIGSNPLHRERLRFLLFEFGPRLLPKLAAMLTEEDLESWEQIIILEVMRTSVYTDKAMEILYLATITPNREVRLAAIKALAAFEDPMLQGFFEDRLEDEDPVIQAIAATALANIGNVQVVPLLAAMLTHNDFWVVKSAAESLLRLGTDGREALGAMRTLGLSGMAEQLVGEVLASR